MADPDFDYVLADQLFDSCYKDRNKSEDAREILDHICLGHNAPEETVKRYREKKWINPGMTSTPTLYRTSET